MSKYRGDSGMQMLVIFMLVIPSLLLMVALGWAFADAFTGMSTLTDTLRSAVMRGQG